MELERSFLLQLGRNVFGWSQWILALLSKRWSLKFLRTYLPILHDLLNYFASTYTPLWDIACIIVLVSTIKLEILNPANNLMVELLLNDFPPDDSVGLKRLILVKLLIDLVDFNCFDFILLFFLYLTIDLSLDNVYWIANCKIYFPKNAFEKCAYHSHKYKVHEDKQENNSSIVIWIFPTIIKGNGWPACLS